MEKSKNKKKTKKTPKITDEQKLKQMAFQEKIKSKTFWIPFDEIKKVYVVDVEGKGDINKGEKTYSYERGEVIYNPQTKKIEYLHSNIDLSEYNNVASMDSAFYGKKKRPFYDSILNPHVKDDELSPKYREYRHNFSSNEKDQTLISMNDTMAIYKPEYLFAYNCKYDCQTLFYDYITSRVGRRRFVRLNFVCIAVNFLHLLEKIPQVRKKYLDFCKVNNYLTNTGLASYKAEYVLRFIYQNLDYEEEHIGLFDALDEKDILLWMDETYKKYGLVFMVEVNNLTYKGINKKELLRIN